MAAREHYSAEILTESTFTSATVWGSACPLTCTLASGSEYIVWWSIEMANRSSVLNDAKCRMTVDAVAMAEFNIEFRSIATEVGGYSGFFKVTGNGSPMALDIEIQAEVAGSNILVRNRRLVVMKMGPGDVYAENLPKTAVDVASTWADVVSLSFTPDAGDYLVIGHSMTENYATTPPVYGTLVFDGVTDIDSRVATNGHAEVASTPTRAPLWKQWKRTVSTSGVSRTVRFQLHSHNTGNPIWGNENRLLLLRLSDFDQAYYADLATLTSVTSTTPTSVLNMTPTVSANPHLVIGSAYVTATSNINDLVYWQTSVDGVPLSSPIVKPYSVTSSRGQMVGSTTLVTPSAGSKTISMDLWTDGSGTVIARPGSVISVLDLGSASTSTTVTATGRQTLSINGYQGSVTAQKNATVTAAGRQTVSITGYPGSVQAGATATASARQNLTITGFAGSVTAQKNATVTAAGRQTLSITGFAGSATGQQNVTVTASDRQTLTITGFEGSVETSGSTTVTASGRQTLSITGFAGSVFAQQNATVTAAGRQTLSITGFVGSVSAVRNVTVEALDRQTLSITGYAGSVQTSGSTTVQAGPRQTIMITGFSGSVSASSTVTASGFQHLIVTGFAGGVSASATVTATGLQTLTIMGFPGSVGSFGNIPNRKARTVSISRSSRTAKLRTARRIVRFRPTG